MIPTYPQGTPRPPLPSPVSYWQQGVNDRRAGQLPKPPNMDLSRTPSWRENLQNAGYMNGYNFAMQQEVATPHRPTANEGSEP